MKFHFFLYCCFKIFCHVIHTGGMEADLSCIEVLEEPIFSRKLLQLIEILSSFRFGILLVLKILRTPNIFI